jgi:serine/threonine protein kinase
VESPDSQEVDSLGATVSFESTDGESAGSFSLDPKAVAAAAPLVLGRYHLVQCVGRGGFGEVWKAFDPHLRRHVALKFPRTDRRFPPEACARFLEEGCKLAHVAECNGIVTVYDAGESDGIAYIVSEFIDGGSLKDRMDKGPLSIVESTQLAIEIANALHAAHLKGLVHRDIKPGNILLRKGTQPLIADFGLAVTEREQLHEPQYTVGTFAYVSPEQISTGSKMANPQADIYSLGVVLYELLTGRLPFISESVRDYKQQLLHRPPRPPRTVNDAIPPELERIILKCLAKEPTDRYTTAADLARDLTATLKSVTATGTANSQPAASRWLHPRWMIAGCLLAAAGLFAAWQQGWFKDRPDSAPQAGPNSGMTPQSKPEQKDKFVFQHWANDELETKRLYRLLRVPPVTLAGPKAGTIGNQFQVDSETLHVSSGDVGLFKFGTVNRPNYTLRVDIRQAGLWQGQVGVFLGVVDTKRTGGKPGRAGGQMIVICPNTGRDAKEFPLQAIRYRVDAEHWQVYPSTSVRHSQKLPAVAFESTNTLELRVRNGFLTSIQWGPHDLHLLRTSELNECFGPEDYRGSFGVVAKAVAGVDFQNATISIIADD